MDLTKRQQEIFDFIRKYSAKYGYPPTVRDIGKAVGLASSSTVHAHLANLEKIGLLRRDPSKPRAIELLDRAVGQRVDSVRGIVRADGLPLVGSVAAGAPMLAEENIEEYVSVPEIAGGEDGEYVLRIRGESMKDAGILEGDYVVVRPQDTAQRRRHRRRAARRGGDGQALLPRTRPHPPAARERDDGADPQQGGQGARARGRAAQERLSGAVLAGPHRVLRACARLAAAYSRGTRYVDGAGQAAAGAAGPRGKSGHHRAGWSRDRPGETRGKVPQKQTAYVRRPT